MLRVRQFFLPICRTLKNADSRVPVANDEVVKLGDATEWKLMWEPRW